MSRNKTYIVAKNEFMKRVKTKWFVFTTLLGPIVLIGFFTVIGFVSASAIENTDATILVLDETERLFKDIKDVDEDIHEWQYPEITHALSVYGVLDQNSWVSFRSIFSSMIRISLWMYSPKALENFGRRITLMDVLEEAESLPKMMLVCGEQDLLLKSSQLVYDEALRKGLNVKFNTYPAHHAFLGVRPYWAPQKWKTSASEATQAMIEFLVQ